MNKARYLVEAHVFQGRSVSELHANCFHPGVARTGFGKGENGV